MTVKTPFKTRSNSDYVSQQLLQNLTNAEIMFDLCLLF